MINSRAPIDNRYVLSGRCAAIFNEIGDMLTSIESFQATVNFATQSYQPLGSAIEGAHITGYTVTIAVTEFVVVSNTFFNDIIDFFGHGRHMPSWTLQSALYGFNDSSERIIYRDCVPDGEFNLHNINVGEVVKRTFNLRCNQPPTIQELLSVPSEG